MADDIVHGAPDNDAALRLAQQAFTESTDYFNAGIRKEIERDMRQAQGLHPTDSKYESPLYRGRAKFFSPKTRAAIRKKEAIAAAAFFSQQDVVSIDPENEDDPANVKAAELQHHLLNIRLKKSVPWFLTLQGAYQDAQTVGVCISHQYWQYNKQKGVDRPWADMRPVENFRFSPGADWRDPVGTSPYLIDMLPMYIKDIEARTKVADGKTGEAKWLPVTAEQMKTAAQKYSDSITLLRNKGRADAQAMPNANDAFQQVWVHRNIVEIDGVDWLWYTLADVTMLSKPVPLDKVYFHGKRPYAIGFCVVESHKVYPSGQSRLTRDVQGELNELRNLRIDNIRFVLNKRYFVRRGAQVDLRSLVAHVPGSATMVGDPAKDVVPNEVRDVTGSAFQEQDRINADFDEVAGSFSQSSIQGNAQLSDKLGGMQILTDDANQLSAYELKCFAETWVKPVLDQFVALEQHYESDPTILKLAGKKAGIGLIDDGLLMMPVSVTVNVGVGAVTPQRRLNNLIFGLKSIKELLSDPTLQNAGLDVEEMCEEILSKCGYDSGARFFNWGDQDPAVASLTQQLQALQQQLSAKQDPPEIIAAKVSLLQAQVAKLTAEKVKVGVEASFGAMQAAEVVAAVPAVAPIADSLMQAAGYEVPVPKGVDPDMTSQGGAAPIAQPDPGLSIQPVSNKRDGIGFTPPGAQVPAGPGAPPAALPPGPPTNTDPMTPKPIANPATGMQGFEHGVETKRPDSGPTRR